MQSKVHHDFSSLSDISASLERRNEYLCIKTLSNISFEYLAGVRQRGVFNAEGLRILHRVAAPAGGRGPPGTLIL